MIRLRHKLMISLLRLTDQIILIAFVSALFHFRPDLQFVHGLAPESVEAPMFSRSDLLAILILVVGWVTIFNSFVRYRADRFVNLRSQLQGLVKATTVSAVLLFIVVTLFSIRSITNLNILIFWLGVSLLAIGVRILIRSFLTNARKSGYNFRHLLVVGTNARSSDLAKRLENSPELGYKLAGFVSESAEKEESWSELGMENYSILGSIADLLCILERSRVDEIMVCLPLETSLPEISKVSRYARDLGIVLRIIPDDTHASLLARMQIEEFEGERVITLFRERMLIQLLAKRFIDLTISSLALIFLSPVMIIAAILIKMTSSGPIFFSQERVGMNQRQFNIYKFRSMVKDAEELKEELLEENEQDGCAFKIENDPRITPLGKFLRKTSIDELPQLINVLKGEMSLVGPRPSLPDEVEKYHWNFRRRLSVKPGITCFWQVSGRNNINFDRWMQMDKDYIDNWSLALDLKILLKTIPAVLLQGGAS